MTVTALRLMLVSLAVVVSPSVSGAGDCHFASPLVNKRGFRPNSTVTYALAGSPSGDPFPADKAGCVQRAFDAWTRANVRTKLNVRFVPGDGGIVVRFDTHGGLVLLPGKGGAWSRPVRSAEGFLEQATIWLSSDTGILDSCEGLTKVTLHELGHLHGLRDNTRYRGPSVMNRALHKNDEGERIPVSPTMCDSVQARHASTRRDVGSSRAEPAGSSRRASPRRRVTGR
jgi:hypothetical protein